MWQVCMEVVSHSFQPFIYFQYMLIGMQDHGGAIPACSAWKGSEHCRCHSVSKITEAYT